MEQQTPLVCPSHTPQYIVAIIIGLIVGAGAMFALNQPTSQNSYEDGFNAAKKRVLESSMGMMFRVPDDIRTVSGTVTAVNGKTVTIHTQTTNPFADADLDDRIITIAADTKITKLSQKDPKVVQAEMDAFMKSMQSGKMATPPATPPAPYTNTIATSADITVGSTLSITATENIVSSKEFTASEIQIQGK